MKKRKHADKEIYNYIQRRYGHLLKKKKERKLISIQDYVDKENALNKENYELFLLATK